MLSAKTFSYKPISVRKAGLWLGNRPNIRVTELVTWKYPINVCITSNHVTTSSEGDNPERSRLTDSIWLVESTDKYYELFFLKPIDLEDELYIWPHFVCPWIQCWLYPASVKLNRD